LVDEAKKTNAIRDAEFMHRYFSGSVIDIGCGPDLVVPHGVPFDVDQGDAQRVLDHFKPESFDCVHSSHCLEHMKNVEAALRDWWALVRPGGYLIIVVPEEDLYEQGTWPSLFNTDHKATFRLFRDSSWSPVSYDIGSLVRQLPGAVLIDATVQDQGYDRRRMQRISKRGRMIFNVAARRQAFMRRLMRRGIPVYRLGLWFDRIEQALGKPFDQTLGPAMAQIQVVVAKEHPGS
jgi:SAM-dependent methyltransferase